MSKTINKSTLSENNTQVTLVLTLVMAQLGLNPSTTYLLFDNHVFPFQCTKTATAEKLSLITGSDFCRMAVKFCSWIHRTFPT